MALSKVTLGKYIPDLFASRIVSWVVFASLIIVVHFFIQREWGGKAAGICSFMILLIPRVYGQALLATTYPKFLFLWFLALLILLEGTKNQKVFWFVFPIVLGFLGSTKVTGIFFLLPLFGYVFFVLRRKSYILVEDQEKSQLEFPQGEKKEILEKYFFIVVFSFLVFFITWPMLWVHPIKTLMDHIQLAYLHRGGWTYLFGERMDYVPWYYPFLIFGITTPIWVGIMGIWGIILEIKKPTLTGSLLFLSLFPFLFLFYSQPKLGIHGVRYFMVSFVCFAIFAGKGFHHFGNYVLAFPQIKKIIGKISPTLVLHMFLLFVFLLQISRVHPNYLSFYNLLVGGTYKAAESGLEFQYWEKGWELEPERLENGD